MRRSWCNMSTDERTDHLVVWWLGILTVVMVAALGTAFQQIESHFSAQRSQDRDRIAANFALIRRVQEKDCAQTIGRWREVHDVVVILVQPYPFPPRADPAGRAAQRAVNTAVLERQRKVLKVIGPMPTCNPGGGTP